MEKIYFSLSKLYRKFNNGAKCDSILKKITLATLLATGSLASAQVLVNPATDGGFENGPAFADNGWTVVNNATAGWTLGSEPAWFSGSRGAYFTSDLVAMPQPWGYNNAQINRVAFYKDVTFPAGPLASATLTFDWRGNGNDGNWDNLLVYVANTTVTPTTAGPTTTNTTTTGWSGYTDGTTGYYLLQRNGTATPTTTTAVSYNFTAAQLTYLAGNTRRLIFVWKNDGGGGANPPAAVDNISLSVSTCFAPTAPVSSAYTPSGATLSWTAPTSAPANGYTWEVRTSGLPGSGATGLAQSGTTAAGVTTTNVTGLSPVTTYSWYVRSSCALGENSNWTSVATFTTPCATIFTVPYFEGFEAGFTNLAALSGCITQASITGTEAWTANSTLTDYNRTPRTGSFNAYLRWSNEDWMFIPIALNAGIPYKVIVHARQDGPTAANANITISYGTANSAAGMTNTILAPTGIINGTYQELSGVFTPSASGNYYIGIKGYMNSSPYYISIDDISVVVAPTDTPDYVNLQYPATATTNVGTAITVYGQVYEGGLTDLEPGLSGQAAGIESWVGVSSTNTDPSTWTNWVVATHNAAHVSNNDEYQANIGGSLTPGTYYYATRFRLNGGAYRYGGIDGSGNGNFWDGVTYNSGVLTVNPIANDDCAGAVSLVVGAELVTTNLYATLSSDTVPTCGTAGSPSFATAGKDVWYSFVVPPNTTAVTAETLTNGDAAMIDTAMMAYRGACGSLVGLLCNDDKVFDTDLFSRVTLTGLTPGETIYLRVWGYAGSSGSFKISTTVPACGIQTTWDGSAWSNGTPIAGVRAVFNGDYSGPGFEACALDVNGTSQVVITSGSDLNIGGIVTVAATASLTLSNDVNLLQSVTTANVGNVIVKRESAPMIRLDYTLWSSPVSGQNLYAFSPNTLTNRFYVYDTATDNYVTTGLSGTSTFTAAKGYGIRAANDHPETATPWMGSFTGIPRNGNQTIALTNAGNGFNLVGNPYPSVVDAALLVAGNSSRITGTLYFYAHTLGMLPDGTYPAGNNYALWNSTGSTASTAGTAGIPANVPNGKIQVGQGFIVKRSGTGDLAFNNSMREASHGNQFFRNANTEVEKHRVWLNLTNGDNTAFSQMLVGYVDGATQGVDNLYDGEAFGQVGSSISSKLDNKNFTIQGRALPFSDEDFVPMNFHAATAGNFTITLSQMDGIFAADQSVYIKDIQANVVHDLKASPYTFVSNAGDFNDRFQIVYRSALSTPESTFNANSVIAFVKNGSLNIQTKNIEMKGITIYDLRGRMLFENQKVNAENYVVPNFASQNQVLLVQVTSENNETATIKVIF